MAGLHAERPLFEKYELGKLLGCGAFAKVYHARDLRTNQSIAIKVIRKKRLSSPVNTKREISIMRRLRHPNIVRLHEVLATKSTIFYAMEYVKGGELFARVAKGRLPEDLTRRFFRQLISAVGYCHSRGVFHRDLKLENLLLDENNNLKVTDFGLSAEAHCADNGLLKTVCGTPAYVAPEILVKKGYGGAAADTWSCGVILFVLAAGYLPFNDPNLMCMYRKIYNGDYKCPRWMSSGLKHLLSRLLDTNPETRITIDGILSDPWFNQGSEPEVNFNPAEEIDEFFKSGDMDEKSTLNAFHLISFSSGLSLSGLFGDGCESDRVVCSDSAGRVFDRIKTFAESQAARIVSVKELRMQLFWPTTKVCVEVDIHRLTDKVIVVEAHLRSGDSMAYHDMWRSKLRHAIVGSGEIDNEDEVEPSDIPNLFAQ